MAIEDEIINIDELIVSKQIQNGDLILIETADGTKLIDYKDFVIGVENITFYDKISGLEDTTASGENLLKSSNIEALSSKTTELETTLSSISSVPDEVSKLQSLAQVNQNEIGKLASQVGANVSTTTTGTVGFSVSRYQQESQIQSITFTEEIFKGSSLNASNVVLRESYGAGLSFKYVANGSYIMHLIGYLTMFTNPINNTIKDSITIQKNGVTIATFKQELTVRVPHFYTVPISVVVDLQSGDQITFSVTTINDARLQNGNLTGTII